MNPNEVLTPGQIKRESWNTPVAIIEEALKKVTDEVISEVSKIDSKGETNEVFGARTENGTEYIIRIFHGERSRFEKERWAIEQSRAVGVPAPEVLLVDRIQIGEELLPICIETKLPGTALNNLPGITSSEKQEDLINLLHQIGSILSKVHSVKTDGFGIIDKEGRGQYSSPQELIAGLKPALDDVILPALSDYPEDLQLVQEAYELLLGLVADLVVPSAQLIHNDLQPEHFFVADGEVTGLIDFESANGADPVLDFALWDLKFGQEYPTRYLLEGYDNQEEILVDFGKRLNFWKIYRSLAILNYRILGKSTKLDQVFNGLREAMSYFTS
jgi:aminoglycoside phosphotransferase (APT) family kinase protein